MTAVMVFLSFRKRILASGCDFMLRMQQPDSTVISDPNYKEMSSSCGASSLLSSNNSVSADYKKSLQPRRSSVISVESDCSFNTDLNPMYNKDSRTFCLENESNCHSPSAHSITNPPFCPFEETSLDVHDVDVSFSPKKTEAVLQNKSRNPVPAAAAEAEADDFYIDDFDIDDFNDSDIPDYFDGPSVSSQNVSAVSTTVKEGGPNKSTWEKKPVTPVSVSAPKPSKICSPGKSK